MAVGMYGNREIAKRADGFEVEAAVAIKKLTGPCSCDKMIVACKCAIYRQLVYIGVWLSLARAPGLGPGGRRFESCHPDQKYVYRLIYLQV